MTSQISDGEKIKVSLSSTDITLEAGQVAQLVITMHNLQAEADRLTIEVEGIDVEWYAIPVAAVNVAAGSHVAERLLFKIARQSVNVAGSYPFLVRVQAMETGEVGVAQASLTLKPFHGIGLEIGPKKAVSTFFNALNDFDITVSNQGNHHLELSLTSMDPEDGCVYEFDDDHLSLEPGQSDVVPLAVRPKVSSIVGGTRLYQFTVTARSVEESYIAANIQGQVEKRSLVSPLVAILSSLILIGLFAFLHFRPAPPKPIKINSFTANSKHVVFGSEVTLSWDVSGTNPQMIIKKHVGEDGQEVNDPGEETKQVGVVAVKPERPVTYYTLVVRNSNGQQEQTREVAIQVDAPPTPPQPKISKFEADYLRIHPGDPVNFSFAAENCKDLILDPEATHISPNDMNHKVSPAETTVYTLRGIPMVDQYKQVSKTLTVTVIPRDQCLADIASFALKEKAAFIGSQIHLVYAVKYAKSLHISTDNNSFDRELDPHGGKGTVEVSIEAPTTYILKATDSAGLVSVKQITVVPAPRPTPQPVPEGGAATTPPQPGAGQ
jgi:hypothetical protein